MIGIIGGIGAMELLDGPLDQLFGWLALLLLGLMQFVLENWPALLGIWFLWWLLSVTPEVVAEVKEKHRARMLAKQRSYGGLSEDGRGVGHIPNGGRQ